MRLIPFPGKGCFEAKYPNKTWQRVPCGPAPTKPSPLALKTRPNQVGAGNDYFAVTTGNISSATGSFDSVSGVTAVYSPTDLSNPTIVHPDTYMLQVNANRFPTQAYNCNNLSNCTGWQQFIFSQRSDCGAPCVYIESWLLNYPSPSSCAQLSAPAGSSGWIGQDATTTTAGGCFLNTAISTVPAQTIADLGKLKLQGTASMGGQDQAILQTPQGDLKATNQDSLLGLAQSWSEAEFNLFGDCCAFEAFLNSGSNLTVRLEVDNGTSNSPQCQTGFTPSRGATAETNNLNLGTCNTVGGASPAIVFAESGGGPLPPGYTVGDTHLTTFFGVHYDFQASGDFVLVQADPGLIVQTRQKPWAMNPGVSVNTAVATEMQDNRIAVCRNGLWVNGSHTSLADGASLSLANGVMVSRRGAVYAVSRESGDLVQADLSPGSYMNVTVALGVTNPYNIRGLLGGEGSAPHDPISGTGEPLKSPFSYEDFQRYAQSWRVSATDSFLLRCEEVAVGMPKAPIYASDLPAPEQERVQRICKRADVKNQALLEDCKLDVSLLHVNSAANVFLRTPAPIRVLKPTYP